MSKLLRMGLLLADSAQTVSIVQAGFDGPASAIVARTAAALVRLACCRLRQHARVQKAQAALLQVVQDCERQLAVYPQTLVSNHCELQRLSEHPAAAGVMLDILGVVVQEQEVLHRTLELARQHL